MSDPKPPRQRVLVEIEDAGDPQSFPARLRRWLKGALRAYRLRNVGVRDVLPTKEEATHGTGQQD